MKTHPITFVAIAMLALFAASSSPVSSKKMTAAVPAPADTPKEREALETLKPPAGEQLSRQIYARGVQIYECNGATGAWRLKEPAAELFDAKYNTVKAGWHFGAPDGPDWQPGWEAKDGSRVLVDRSKAKSVPVRADAIPWLWVPAAAATGDGMFGKVKSVQRIKTEGGLAPTGGCDAAHAGNERPVYYTAVYNVFTDKP